jgi:hypothetical protein
LACGFLYTKTSQTFFFLLKPATSKSVRGKSAHWSVVRLKVKLNLGLLGPLAVILSQPPGLLSGVEGAGSSGFGEDGQFHYPAHSAVQAKARLLWTPAGGAAAAWGLQL